jgi:polyisoprenyl-phosphate glycosyltransferase
MDKKLISIVLPVYNEEKNLVQLHNELSKVFSGLAPQYDYEFLFINDGSTDGSLAKLKEISSMDPHAKLTSFSRNFGNQAAITCGLRKAKGDFVISMDSDLQDPPNLIPLLLKKAEEGADIVYARILKRNDGFFKKLSAQFYYFLLEGVGNIHIPRNVGDYRLVTRKVLDVINRCEERSRYLRGLVAWVGFRHDFVDFERPNRQNGTPGYSWKKLLRLALDGFTGFSFFPLKISAFVGIFVILTSILMFLYMCFDFFIRGNHAYPLYKWLIIIVYGFTGLQFILVWLLGEYIGRIYDEQRGRPLYIIEHESND